MSRRRGRRAAALASAMTAAVAISCAPKQIRSAAEPRGDALIVLLPDADSGTTGRAEVSNAAGKVDLGAARESTTVVSGQAPSAVTVMDAGDVQRVFGDALAALPPPPIHFVLFYKFDSDELTDESRALVPDVLAAVKSRPIPEVVIIGHTDTAGPAANNFILGMRRAVAVRALLLEAGLDPSLVDVTSHGEADLLVPTADNIAEPRNRRVEITVR
jgi:outer membrane protein OmpA-like peptidoglycan-associated protein